MIFIQMITIRMIYMYHMDAFNVIHTDYYHTNDLFYYTDDFIVHTEDSYWLYGRFASSFIRMISIPTIHIHRTDDSMISSSYGWFLFSYGWYFIYTDDRYLAYGWFQVLPFHVRTIQWYLRRTDDFCLHTDDIWSIRMIVIEHTDDTMFSHSIRMNFIRMIRKIRTNETTVRTDENNRPYKNNHPYDFFPMGCWLYVSFKLWCIGDNVSVRWGVWYWVFGLGMGLRFPSIDFRFLCWPRMGEIVC